jgi:hypothetical protein
MSRNLPFIILSHQLQFEQVFAVYQTTHQFYQEVQTRSEFQSYCQWYKTTAAQNRRDLEKMRGELNIAQWFRRRS